MTTSTVETERIIWTRLALTKEYARAPDRPNSLDARELWVSRAAAARATVRRWDALVPAAASPR